MRCFRLDSLACSRTASYIFSYTRGTLVAVLGATAWKSALIVSELSAYATHAPQANITKWPAVRSKTCASGRKETVRVSASRLGPTSRPGCGANRLRTWLTFDRKLRCVSFTPFGWPVVPEV
jgi:hypothetical protein